MAWQLIYTSAPRLLEAGRTGFGTVARHRAVSGLLAAAVERFSQFARLPGHDPRRIVRAHRILTVGSGTFHVLSCLQDAGSDYTGRTNHIAHHLIAEPSEIRALSAAGLTLADVLLAMTWRSSWSEGPRYFDPAEEVDLSSFTASTSHAWVAVTGNPASAGILWSREALKGCYLITPSGINGLELFRESLLVEPAQAWQTRFTTCLEPNDDVADFQWVALSAASPMRAQVDASNRLVLDLTRPETLPAPPALEVARPVLDPASPAVPAYAIPPPAPEQPFAPAPLSSMDGWSPAPRRKAVKSNRSFIGISLVIAAVMILVVVGALLRQDNLQRQVRADYEKEIAQTWKDHRLILNETRRLLKEQPDLEAGMALLKSHENFFRSMQQLLREPSKPAQLSLPSSSKDDLVKLKELLHEWAQLQVSPWTKLQTDQDAVAAMITTYRRWQDARTAKWKQLREYVNLSSAAPPADDLVRALQAEAMELLRRAEPARGTLPTWKQLFELLGLEKSATKPGVWQWLQLWAELDDASAKAYAMAQKAAADSSLPEWLRNKAVNVKQRHDGEHASQMPPKTDDPPKEEAKKPAATMQDADAVSARNPLYIRLHASGEDPTGKVTGLPVAAGMRLYVGGAWDGHTLLDAQTEPKDGELKKWSSVSLDDTKAIKFGPTLLANLTDMIVFSNDGTLTALPESWRKSPDGIRIVARSHDAIQVLFDLRLIPASSVASKPVFTQVIGAGVNNADAVTLSLPAGFLPRLHLVGLPNPVYALRRDGSAMDQKFYELKSSGDSAFQVMPPQIKMISGLNQRDIRRQIRELEKGIAKDDSDLAKNESGNLSPRQKEINRETYKKGRAAKELKLQALQAQLQSLESQPPLHFDLLPGAHTLLLEQPNKIELCKLNVVPAASPSKSKPSNP